MRNLIIFGVFVLYLFNFNSWARKPAVDPQMTITTEHIKQQAPAASVATGYNFSDQSKTAAKPVTQSPPLQGGFPFLLIILAVFLPFGMWFAITTRASKQPDAEVIEFPTESEKDDHDHEFPEAS